MSSQTPVKCVHCRQATSAAPIFVGLLGLLMLGVIVAGFYQLCTGQILGTRKDWKQETEGLNPSGDDESDEHKIELSVHRSASV